MNPLFRLIDVALERADSLLERFNRRPALVAGLLLSPSLLIIGVFAFFPLLYAIYISMFDTRRGVFAGLGNYRRALYDPEFWRSVKVTCYYAVGTVPLSLIISFGVAWLLFRIVRARGLFRTLYFLPYVTSAVASATVWRALLRPQSGLVNLLLVAAGLEPQKWLIEPRGVLHILTHGLVPPGVGPSLALCCIVAFDVWHASGFMIVVFLAGLSSIPKQLEEGARLDGATTLQVIRHVSLPLLSPTVFFLITVSAIKSFQSFNSFYTLVGTPGEDTQNLIVLIYRQIFQNTGYGAAVSILMCAAIVTLTVLQWRLVGRRVHYE